MAWQPQGGFRDSTGAGGGPGFNDRGGGSGFNDRRGGDGPFRGSGSGFNRPKEEHVYDTTQTVLPPPPEGWPRNQEWNLEAYKKYKAGKMSLTGVRNRHRKRDVKKK